MIKFDSDNTVQDFTFILSLKNHDHLGQLRNIDPSTVNCNINMSTANEISFTIYKYNKFEMAKLNDGDETRSAEIIEGKQQEFEEPLWDEITDFKFIYVKELDEYFEITVDKNDEESLYKNITGTDASVVELSQTYVYNLEINTELDIARTDYIEPTIFYNPEKPECSLLHRVLYKLPQYSIKHVDSSIATMQRTFSADSTDVYSFLTGEVAEEFSCLFVFDSVDRSISAYDLKTVCVDCGYRGEFNDVCPKCGSENLKYYGEDTTVFVDSENLIENVTLTVDTESVKNCFKLEAGDDNITAAVINLNPNGSDYLYYFSDEQKHDMPVELVERLDSYNELMASYDEEYTKLTEDMYEAIDKIIYYTSGMMPGQKEDPTNAALEAAKLTEAEMSPMGVTEVTQYTSTATVNTALKNYAKVFVKSGYFKVEINQGEFNYEGTDENGLHYGYWFGNFKVTNYSDEEDVATSELIRIKVCDDFETYMVQKIKKKLALDDEKEGSIFDVLSIEDLGEFTDALTYYGLNRLQSFYDAVEGCLDIMIEMDLGHENNDLYVSLYQPYYQKLQACQKELDKRQVTIDEWTATLERIDARRIEIQKILNFENYLGTDLHKVFCMYKREDKYSNENYISNGLENNEILERAKQFFEVAKTEIIKAGTHQRNITADLLNLLCMKEFEPIKDKFKIGNFIRVKIDKEIYRLRLINYQLSFGEIQKLSVEFSDAIRVRDGVSDIQSVLSKAQSMASSYGGIANQVRDSKKETDRMKNWVASGLAATEVKIVNNASNQNIVMNDGGLLARQKDDFSDEYSDCQVKLLSTGIYTTRNKWATVDAALGKFYSVNPETGETEILFGLNAQSIVGDLIIGQRLGIYSEDRSAQMSFDSNGLILNTVDDGSGIYKKVFAVQKDGVDQMYIDSNGNLVIANDQIIETNDTLASLTTNVLNLNTKVNNAEKDIDNLQSDVSSLKTTTTNISNNVTNLSNTVNSIDNSVDNIIYVLSGNAGSAPLQKIYLNTSNAVISEDLLQGGSGSGSGTTPTYASQIKCSNGSSEITVQEALDNHKSDIASLMTLVQTMQAKINELEATINEMKNETTQYIVIE